MGKNIVKATGLVLIINMTVKILGLLRESFIADAFGAGLNTDAYLVAYTIPYFLQWVLGAAIVAAIVPVLSRYLTADNKKEAWYVSSAVFNITVVVMTALTLICYLLCNVLIKILAPGFAAEAAQLASHLSYIMLPSAIFMSAAMVVTGTLNASYKFSVAAFAPGFSSLIIIVGIVLFSGSWGIDSLAWATLLSYLGFLLIQLPSLKKIGFKYHFTLGLKHEGVRQIVLDVLPITLGIAVNQIYFALNRVFASGLAEGSISALNYGNKLMMLPMGVFVAAVAATIYPALSEMAIKKDKVQFARTLKRGIGVVTLVSAPAMVGLIVLRVPIVQLLFERGAFDHAATLASANALLFFCVGLVPMAINMVLTRSFYSLDNVKTPVKIALYSVLANIVLSLILYRLIPFGGGGLALSNSLAALVNTVWLYVYLQRKMLPELKAEGKMMPSMIKIAIGSLIMGIVVYICNALLLPVLGVVISVFVNIMIGVIVYFICMLAMRLPEMEYLTSVLKRKLGKKSA